jgi:hypothetical protein
MASLTTSESKGDSTNDKPVFDDEEQKAILELRQRLLPKYKDDEWFSTYLDDSTLWRYLVAREMDIEKAEEMFVSSTDWKREQKLRQRKQEYLEQKTRWSRIARRVFYGGIAPSHVQTKNGGPVAFERLGQIDLGGMYRNEDEFQNALYGYMLYLEDCWNSVRAHPGTKQQALIINDATGISLSFLWYVKTFKRIVDIGPANYPEVTYKVIIVNAPSAVTAIWAVVSAFLPTRTKEKVVILGSDYMETVCSELKNGRDDLPDYLGGPVHYSEEVLPLCGEIEKAIEEVDLIEKNELAAAAEESDDDGDGEEEVLSL